jgi:mono/diheme cytochrome c family protein
MAPDLTYHKLELSEIISIVKYGKNSMPSYKDMLSEKEIESVSYYLYKKN